MIIASNNLDNFETDLKIPLNWRAIGEPSSSSSISSDHWSNMYMWTADIWEFLKISKWGSVASWTHTLNQAFGIRCLKN